MSTIAHPQKSLHPHRTDDTILGITLAAVIALPFIVRQAMREPARPSHPTLRSFLRG
jgi:hypothetical protein